MGANRILIRCGILICIVVFVFCSSGAGIVTVDVKTVKDLLHSGYGFLDVRSVEEFKEGHVATEKIFNIPYQFNSPNGGRVKNPLFLEEVLAAFKKDDRLVVGCRSGVRSLLAMEELLNAGFEHLIDMGGGYLAWVKNGFPVTKPEMKIGQFPVTTPEIKIADRTVVKSEL